MNNIEEHELRLKYLDVLMKHGVPLETASKYFDNIMKFDEIKKTAHEAELQKALSSVKLTPLAEFTEEDKKSFMEAAGILEKEPIKKQIEFDFVGPHKTSLLPRIEDHVEDIKKDLPSFNPEIPMVDPKGDKPIVGSKEGIQESTTQKMGPIQEQLPLRYEDRIKFTQK
jgi:hypothetical protein